MKAQCVCLGVVVHFCSCFNSFVSNTLSYTTISWNQFFFTEISKIKEPSLYALKLCLQIFDYCALTIFVLEIILKWIDGFWKFWNNGWNIFDFLVTLMVSTLSISQSINQSINQSTLIVMVSTQSANQSFSQSVNQQTNQSINLSKSINNQYIPPYIHLFSFFFSWINDSSPHPFVSFIFDFNQTKVCSDITFFSVICAWVYTAFVG